MKKLILTLPFALLLAACGSETPQAPAEPEVSVAEWRIAIQDNDAEFEARAVRCEAAITAALGNQTQVSRLDYIRDQLTPSCRNFIDAIQQELGVQPQRP